MLCPAFLVGLMLSVNGYTEGYLNKGCEQDTACSRRKSGRTIFSVCLTHNEEYKLSTNHQHERAGMERACAITGTQINKQSL